MPNNFRQPHSMFDQWTGTHERSAALAREEARFSMLQTFRYSEDGLALTREFEGLRLLAYQDCAGVWTIGYGHTGPDVTAGKKISEFEAEALLRADAAEAVACVNRVMTVPVRQNQFDALVDFCFNTGVRAFTTSSLLRCVNTGKFDEAAAQFGLWVHAGGKVVPGLAKRRAAEAAMFRGAGLEVTIR